jgi:simple sugar transport system ATP-binding protein
MTATAETTTGTPLVRLDDAGKNYGSIIALQGVTLDVGASEVTCVLGDNGAGKSTLIKIIAGLHQHTHGTYEVEGEPVQFASPREALDRGIATVYQDLAVVPLMPVWRNFFLGNEVRKGPTMDIAAMRKMAKQELLDMGIDLRDVDQPIGTLSGGERQCVAIARAVHFGARVLILDEPTAALGVKQSGVVLRYIIQAKERGLGVIFITHNPHHAYPVGDRFLILKRGRSLGYWKKNEITMGELTGLMAGGSELEELTHELEQAGAEDSGLREVAHVFEQEVAELHVAELGAGTTRTPPTDNPDAGRDPTEP